MFFLDVFVWYLLFIEGGRCMSNKYSKEFEIYYCDTSHNYEATPIAILKYLQEAAISHSSAVGYGVDELKRKGVAWILNRWNLKMKKYPLLGDKVIIETWPSRFERFYAQREFVIKNGDEFLGDATSLWIFFDINRKRPTRILHEIIEKFNTESSCAFDETFKKLTSVESIEGKKEFFVRKSDIDSNNHVNNVIFAEWMLEVLPLEISERYFLSSFEIAYKKEVNYGYTISSVYQKIKNGGNFEYLHGILDKDNAELAVGKTCWTRR